MRNTARRVSRRIQQATMLNLLSTRSSEPYQVVNYGLGGQYNIHPDSFGYHLGTKSSRVDAQQTETSKVMGDRIMTLMIYLSSVVLGGGTVFPAAGIRTEAVRGSAVLWKNMYLDSGTPDPLSIHGGCPVAVGSKWVTNKWIHWYDQADNYPCPLKPGGPDTDTDIIQTWRRLNQ